MNIKVLYFAQLRERFGLSEEHVQAPASVRTVKDLIEHLSARGGRWADTFDGSQAFRIAMNQFKLRFLFFGQIRIFSKESFQR